MIQLSVKTPATIDVYGAVDTISSCFLNLLRQSQRLLFPTKPRGSAFASSTWTLLWLISSLIVVAGTNLSTANAETLTIVEDLNKYSRWRITEFASDGNVAFHLQTRELNGRSVLWRSTEQATEQIDIGDIGSTGESRVSDMFLSENYLYFRTYNTSSYRFDSLYQMRLDGLQIREIPTPAERYSFHSPLIDEESDTIYFLENGPDSRNDGIFLFKLDEQAATLTRIGDEILDRRYGQTSAGFTDGRIVFNGHDALWSVDPTGQDIRELIRFSDNNNGLSEPVFGGDIAYFSFRQAGTYVCDLWRSDGTVSGTFTLTSIPLDFDGYCTFETVVRDDNSLVLTKIHRRPWRAEIWETDGSIDGTRQMSGFPLAGAQRSLDLSKANNQIWYTRTTGVGRSVIYVTDPTFATSRRVMAVPRNFWVRFFPLSTHMLVQFRNSVSSILYRVDHDGTNRAALYRGINSLYTGQIVEAGNLVILPFQTLGEPREFLMAVDLATRKRTVRLGWRDTNGSSAISPRIIEGADGSVYFCAMDVTRNFATIVEVDNGFAYTRAAPAIWRTDAAGEVSNRIVPIDDSSIRPSSCGDFAVGSEKIFYSREARLGPGTPQSELWSANLDGTEQKLFINFGATAGILRDDSSSPQDVYALTDGGVIYTAEYGHFSNRKRILLRGYSDGSYEILGDEDATLTEIVKQTGNQFWIRSADGPLNSNPNWSLWLSDGSQSGTKLVARGMYANGFAEIDGDVYFTGEFRKDPNRREGLFKVAASEYRPTFVAKFAMQRRLEACCTETNRLSDFISDFRAFDEDIVFTQRPYTGQANDQVRRFDTETLRESVLFDSSTDTGLIKSSAIFSGYVYVFKEKYIDKGTVPDWEIWRSAGSDRDALRVRQQQGDSVKSGLYTKSTHGILKTTSQAIWFFAGDKRLGNELWQLTP